MGAPGRSQEAGPGVGAGWKGPRDWVGREERQEGQGTEGGKLPGWTSHTGVLLGRE